MLRALGSLPHRVLLVLLIAAMTACVGEPSTESSDTQTTGDTTSTLDTSGASDTGRGDTSTSDSAMPDIRPEDTFVSPDTTGTDVPPAGNICQRAPDSIDFIGVLDAFAEAACLHFEQCGSPMPLVLGAPDLSLQACIPAFKRMVQFDPTLGTSIAQGFVHFDPLAAAQCITSVCTMASCSLEGGFEPDDPACDLVFRGQVGLGEDCYGGMECAAGHCDGLTCPGQCVAGGDCRGDCPANQFCDHTAGTCVDRLAPNANCETTREGCPVGYYCGRASATVNYDSCIPLEGSGGTCSTDETCTADLYCQVDVSTQVGFCNARLAAGMDCDRDRQCEEGARCVGSLGGPRRCVVPSYGLPQGAACVPMLDSCEWPNSCVVDATMQFECGPLKPKGQPCVNHLECHGYCDAVDQKCADRKAGGALCQENAECLGFCAPDGRCHDTRLLGGTPCNDDRECASGSCLDVSGANAVCRQLCER